MRRIRERVPAGGRAAALDGIVVALSSDRHSHAASPVTDALSAEPLANVARVGHAHSTVGGRGMDSHEPAMSRSQAFEESENVGRNASANPTMGDIIATRYNRRDLLKNSLAVAAITATVSPLALAAGRRAEAARPGELRLHRGRGRRRRDPSRGPGLPRRHPDPLGRPGPARAPRRSTRTRRPPRRRSSSSATTTTSSATSRSRAAPSTACSWSITSTPTRR